jgi:hydrogenase maturation protease
MSTPERITVMGIGNPLMRDEGVGVRVVEEIMQTLEFPPNVEVVDAGTMGMSILHILQSCDYLLVVDAIDGTGEEPGTVVRLSPEDLAPSQVMHSLHDMRLVDVLEAAMLSGRAPEAADCIGIQIADIGGMEIGLTPAVDAAVPAAVAAVLEVLAERGVTAKVREGASVDGWVLESVRTKITGPRGGEDGTS